MGVGGWDGADASASLWAHCQERCTALLGQGEALSSVVGTDFALLSDPCQWRALFTGVTVGGAAVACHAVGQGQCNA